MLDHSLGGGFSDPVFQSQAAFRAIMDAMARPGSVQPLDDANLVPPASLSRGVALVTLTVCDHDTPVWLGPALADAPGVAAWQPRALSSRHRSGSLRAWLGRRAAALDAARRADGKLMYLAAGRGRRLSGL